MQTAALLPNVTEYLMHIERHQRAYAMHTVPKSESQAPPRDGVGASWHGAAPPPLPPTVPNGLAPSGASLSVAAGRDMLSATTCAPPGATTWPDVRQVPQCASSTAPLAPHAPSPDPGSMSAVPDGSAASADFGAFAAAKSSSAALPMAHALPVHATAAQGLGNLATSSLGSQPSTAAASAAALSLQGMLPGADAATLSMVYAQLASHFAQVAQASTPAAAAAAAAARPPAPVGSMPTAPVGLSTAPQQTLLHGMPGLAGMPRMPDAPPALPAGWHPSQPTTAPGFLPPMPPRDMTMMLANGGAPPQMNMMGMAMNAMSALPDPLKRPAEAALSGGGCAMLPACGAPPEPGIGAPSHGLASFPPPAGMLPSYGSSTGTSGFSSTQVTGLGRALPSTTYSLEPRASKQPRHMAPPAAFSAAPASKACGYQQSLAQNLAAACGATVDEPMSCSAASRQMSDEEVFSMFADDLQQLDNERQEHGAEAEHASHPRGMPSQTVA